MAKAAKVKDDSADLTKYKQTVVLTIDGQSVVGTIRQFASGSIGYNLNGKIVIDEKKCQLSGNIVIIGTKPKSGE